MAERLLRLRQVQDVTGFGRSWIYEMVREGRFPGPIKFGRSSAWLESEVTSFIDAQIRASRRDEAAP